MSVVAADIGCKKSIFCKWIDDPYNINPEGIPFFILNDRGKARYGTHILLGKEVFFNDSVGTRITSNANSCISGCFQFFPEKCEEDIALEKLFNPSTVLVKDGIVYFNMESGNGEVKDLPIFIPVAYFLENLIFSVLKTGESLMNQRQEIARQHSEDVDWYLVIPDGFDTREIEMLKSVIHWQNYNHFVFTKSCLAPLIEYGYHNLEADTSKVCLFVDSGDSHTSFTIAEFIGSSIQILYHRVVNDISGRKATNALFHYVCGDTILSMSHKACLRCLNVIEKAKCELNIEGMDETYIDLSDILDEDEAFEDDICVTKEEFDDAIADMTELFTREFNRAIHCVEMIYNKKIDHVFPLGGNCHLRVFTDAMRSHITNHNPRISNLNYTLNMDECFVTGTTLLGHLVDEKKIWVDHSLLNVFLFPTSSLMESKILAISKEQAALHISIHPDCLLPPMSKETYSFDHFRPEFLVEYSRISEMETFMRKLNLLCGELENELNRANALLEKQISLKDYWNQTKTPDHLIQNVRERIVQRYHLPAFPACFECAEHTKKSSWWKDTCESLKKIISGVSTSARDLIAMKEQVYSSIYTSSRSMLEYDVVCSERDELTRLIGTFEDSCQSLEYAIKLVIYHFANKAKLKSCN